MRPVAASERYASLDILRGIALYGVLIINLLTIFRISLFAHILGVESPVDPVGNVVRAVIITAIEFKAYSLFSFLFGIGVALQAGRAPRNTVSRFLARRFLVLLAIGLTHLLLIWNGDILTLYAICGLLLIPLLRLPNIAIAAIGLGAIVIPYFAPLPIPFPSSDALREHVALANRIYAHGGWREILAFRWQETRTLMVPLLLWTLPKTLGLMLWGVAAWRLRLLESRRRLWLAVLACGGAIGIVGITLHNDLLSHVPLALAYAAAILLWIPRAPLFAAAGQMALTNYLAQSVVFGFVFYGYGGGFFGQVAVLPAAVSGTLLYIAQLFFSRWWLSRFRFGPCEWLWRSLTYGYRQPMRRGQRKGFLY